MLAELRHLDPGDGAERPTGRGSRAPRLRGLGVPTQTPQHASPLGGQPLIRPPKPARSRVARGIPGAGPRPPKSGRTRGDHHGSSPRASGSAGLLVAAAGGTGDRPKGSRPGGAAASASSRQSSASRVAPVAGIGAGEPGEVAARRHRPSDAGPRSAAPGGASRRASDRTSDSLWRTTTASGPVGRRAGSRDSGPGSPSRRRRPCRATPSSAASTVFRRASSRRWRNTRRTSARRSRWPACAGASRPAIRYRATSSGQSKPRPLYVTSQPPARDERRQRLEQRGLVGVVRQQQLDLAEPLPDPPSEPDQERQRARRRREAGRLRVEAQQRHVRRRLTGQARQALAIEGHGHGRRLSPHECPARRRDDLAAERRRQPLGELAAGRRPAKGARAGGTPGPPSARPSVARRFARRRSRGTPEAVMPRPPRAPRAPPAAAAPAPLRRPRVPAAAPCMRDSPPRTDRRR